MKKASDLFRESLVYLFCLFFMLNLEAGESGSTSYRERFSKAPNLEREESIEEGKGEGGDGGGGGSKGGKSRKKKKKKDDVRRVVGPRDPIVPVTGVEKGDLTAVTYKSPTPTAPFLEKAWNSTAWAPTYQPASRSLLGGKGDLSSVIQSDLIEHTGWKVDGDSISISPDLNGGPYDVETGQPITFTVDRETSVDFLGIPGQISSAVIWDNPISLVGPNNPFSLVRKNPLKNPFGIVQSLRRLANHAGVLSAWAFDEGGVQITEDGSIGIVHDPSGGEALWAGAGIALWFTPIKVGPVLSAGARMVPGATRTLAVAAALGRGAWGRVAGFSQRAWGHVTGAARGFGHWAAGTARDLGRGTWGVMEFIARNTHSPGMSGGQPLNAAWQSFVRALSRIAKRDRPYYDEMLVFLNSLNRGDLFRLEIFGQQAYLIVFRAKNGGINGGSVDVLRVGPTGKIFEHGLPTAALDDLLRGVRELYQSSLSKGRLWYRAGEDFGEGYGVFMFKAGEISRVPNTITFLLNMYFESMRRAVNSHIRRIAAGSEDLF